MALKEKLERLKRIETENSPSDWDNYKEVWKEAVSALQNKIVFDWFKDYEQNGLMRFAFIPVSRLEPYIGSYLAMILEIELSESKFVVLQPVSAVTSEYDGKMELYMRGNISEKVNVLREIHPDGSYEWLVATSLDKTTYRKFDREELEKLIEGWLQ